MVAVPAGRPAPAVLGLEELHLDGASASRSRPGLLSVDDKVVSFFDEDLPEKISDNLAAMEIRHLLTMTTGHAEDTIERADPATTAG